MHDLTDNPLGTNTDLGRRRFLRIAGLSTAAGAAATSIGQTSFAQTKESSDKKADNEAETTYRETEHVRAFYATLRD